MTDSLAAVVWSYGEPLALERVPVPELEPGGVLVRVDAATLCGTDVHFWQGMIIPPDSVPYIPGHETCGTIVDLRRPRTDLLRQPLQLGDRIIAAYPLDQVTDALQAMHDLREVKPVVLRTRRGDWK